jgi:hypothetical protein
MGHFRGSQTIQTIKKTLYSTGETITIKLNMM